ncbi:hypothetical protein RJ639_013398 [Escallonia herrerae]|uniref:Uncharacterized protein n=1 Tax=Escallonia herrerae TaxID=1293975 RepID=A0AA88VJY0_9ASTE|nr:hypothetical protein RJ639_013398 [Escallonia herrerae]
MEGREEMKVVAEWRPEVRSVVLVVVVGEVSEAEKKKNRAMVTSKMMVAWVLDFDKEEERFLWEAVRLFKRFLKESIGGEWWLSNNIPINYPFGVDDGYGAP